MSFLQDPIAVAALTSFIIQIIVLFLLVTGYSLKRKSKFRSHGLVMATAVVLHLITILAVMIPNFPIFFSANIPLIDTIIGITHGILGSLGLILGIVLVSAWQFKKDLTGCFKRKRIMLATITIWISALVIGIIIFGIYYIPYLLG
jgi:uncharacterized membrane protein YozB (DUF420 family)